MIVALPRTIADYFVADSNGSAAAVADCFTATAEVKDEGHTYLGQEEIRQWKAESSRKYSYTVEPVSIVEEGGRTIVTGHVAGNFPGSPVDLRYAFVLDGEKIAGLEIGA